MIAGHFGFAALVKSRERQAPLWALMLSTVWLDIVFVPLFLAGIETIELVPGTHGGYGAGIIHADYTHSLVGALFTFRRSRHRFRYEVGGASRRRPGVRVLFPLAA